MTAFYSFIFIINGITGVVMSSVLENEKSSFLGLTHETVISGNTVELIGQLEEEVFAQDDGGRRIRRYFDAYDTPFVGSGRRNFDSDDN